MTDKTTECRHDRSPQIGGSIHRGNRIWRCNDCGAITRERQIAAER